MSGTLNSINTNAGSMIALDALNKTNTSLNAVQKQISTGYRVADAVDDGAAYAVAQSVRSAVGALTTVNQQLGSTQGLLSATSSALNDVSGLMASMRDVLTDLASTTTSSAERTQYTAQYSSLLANVKSDVQDAAYNGQSLIGDITGSIGNAAGTTAPSRTVVTRNEVGSTYGIGTTSGSALYASLAAGTGTGGVLGQSTAQQMLTATGMFANQTASVNSAMNTYGAATNYISNQISYNSDKINSLNSGLGSLVDADLAQESALLQSLQIKQQLGTQSLTLADQTPQVLLSLVKAA